MGGIFYGQASSGKRCAMTTFDDREKAFEKRFSMDSELKFKAEARRNKLLGHWAAAKLGLSDAAEDAYVKAVLKADLLEKGGNGVVHKIAKDFADKGINLPDTALRKQMGEFLAEAVRQIEAESK